VSDPSHFVGGEAVGGLLLHADLRCMKEIYQPLRRFTGEIPTPPPNLEEVWGRIEEGVKRADMTGKSRWGFYRPPLNPLP